VIVGKNKIVKNVSKPAVHKVPKKQNVLKPLMTAKPTGKSHYAEKKIEKKVTKQREECLSRVNTDRDKCVNKQEQSLMEWVNGKLLSQGIETGDDNAYDEFDRCRTEEKHRSEFAEILNDEDTVSVLRRVKSEVFSNRLSLRADRNVKAHVGFKDGITNMLLSYDPIFLRLGLETVFDMKISVPDAFNLSTTISKKSTEKKHTSSIWTHQLKKVIQDKVLHSTEIDATYLKEGVIVTPAIEKKIQESLRQHILSCVLAIIFVLDEARMNNMCSCHLTLFRTDAEIKSSKDMIVELSRSFLQHEGDVVKHLSGLGYTVEFVQTTFHDFDFQCTNILADLRDGVRLARLVDLLCDSNESHSLVSSLLRVPAVSRLQKMHNVGISLKYLRMNGLDLHNIDEKSIVDGHQNSTILLLWTLLFEFDLKFVVGLSDIKTEIENIGNEKGEEFSSIEEVKEPKAFFGQLKSLLLTWCDSIAFKHQNLNIQNMSESLIDGQMLCLLVHHYHSNVLPLELIKDSSDSSNIGGEKKTIIYSLESLSKNNRNVVRRSNLLTLSRALKVLGGVPFMLSTEGSTDERTMVMFLGFLFARLMHTSKQSTEASLIQKTIRSNKKTVVPHIQSHSDITVTVYESKKQTAMVLIEKFVSENWSRRRNALRHQLLKDENSVQKTVEEVYIEKEESNHAFEKKESNHALVKEESNRASEKEESNLASEKDESNRASENEESNHASEKDESNHASLEVVVQDEISDAVDIDDILFADVEQPMENAVECKDSSAEIERVDITNMHKICMTEMVLKVKSGAALKNETLGRLAAEQKLEELRNFYESSMSSALSAQRSLEAKLAFEVKEKERIRLEMEISNLEDMINVAEAKLMKECKEYHATLTIQKFGNLALREIRWRASVAEQAHHVVVRCKAAVTLQSLSRGLVFRRQFRKLRASACVIQQKVRSRQAMLLHQRQSDIARHLISTWIEGVILKARFCKIRKAVVSIQRFYTSRIVRKGFLHSKMQICKIQQAWKLHLRNVALKRHRSAVLIQSVVIKKVYVKNAKQRVSAMKLQSFWARCKLKIALFKEKESSVNKHLSASIVAKSVLVRFFRRAVTRKLTKRAALTIERWLVWCLPGVRARKLVNGFIRLQVTTTMIVIE
jgi:abnormal spindle-like microcephaly-associated protein